MTPLQTINDREVERYDEATKRASSYIASTDTDFTVSFDDLVEDFYGLILATEDLV